MLRAVFFDFGGVITASPFEAFNDYERSHGLPVDFIRSVNAVDPDANAWARLERRELEAGEFDLAFAGESERLGHRVPGRDVLALLSGTVRPEMVAALDAVLAAGYVTACLTNNHAAAVRPDLQPVLARFHHVFESSKLGIRKPEPAFYETACRQAGVAPREVVFLDDLGVNLRPAREMGMTTIKVVTAEQALADLGRALGLPL